MASFPSRLALIAVLALAACGPAPSATSATTSSSTSPTAGNAGRLFVIVEGKTRCYGTPCTVAIVDLDGHIRARRTFKELNLDVCILPGYAPRQSLAALLAAKSLGIRTVMMNEGHAGTSRAQGLGAIAKQQLMALFDSALVGGNPQKRYVASFGLSQKKIFTGYDAVDNDYFSSRADEIRGRADEIRARFDLPEHYFLSLGRFVTKKNLATLIRAYRMFLNANPETRTHLVMVGSGEEDSALRKLCHELRLPVYDKGNSGSSDVVEKAGQDEGAPGIHFYGFRQIEDNLVFYSLADAFVLPSLWEEWGLVVNEAMASGLPVIVSETAGCAEDLLLAGRLAAPPRLSENQRECLAQLAGRTRQNGFVFNPRSAQSLANAFTLQCHVLALAIWTLFREANEHTAEIARRQLASVRPLVFKVGALVEPTVRRVWFHLSSTWPGRDLFIRVCQAVSEFTQRLGRLWPSRLSASMTSSFPVAATTPSAAPLAIK